MGGDDDDVPLTDRPEFAAALAQRPPAAVIEAFVRAMARVAVRVGGLLVAFEDAAAADAGTAELWSRRCEVVTADRGRAFAFRTLPERLDVTRRDSTTWRYDLEPVDGGTRVRHSYEITTPPVRPLRALFGALLPHHRDMRPQMRANLDALRKQFPASAG
jgi:hypothetical protein